MWGFALGDVALIAWYIGVLVVTRGAFKRRQCAGAGRHGPASLPAATSAVCCDRGSGAPSGFASSRCAIGHESRAISGSSRSSGAFICSIWRSPISSRHGASAGPEGDNQGRAPAGGSAVSGGP